MASTVGENTPAPSVISSDTPSVKLPLAARKSLRDDWESQRPALEQRVSEVTGVPWSFPVDYGTVWPWAKDGYPKENPGSCVYSYISAFAGALERFKEKHELANGISELNRLTSNHAVILAHVAEDEIPGIRSCGSDIKDGVFRIVFTDTYLGVNIDDSVADILGAVNRAYVAAAGGDSAASALDFKAKSDIAIEWTAKATALTDEFKRILDTPVFTLSPNFEENAAMLQAYEEKQARGRNSSDLREDWRARIGEFTYAYFESAKEQLVYLKFDIDEMMRDAFREGVERNEISLRVVEKLGEGKNYNEVVIESGVLVIRTVPGCWAVNVGDPVAGVVDIL